MRSRAFTLLEAVLALAILGLAVGACLQLRAELGASARTVARHTAADNRADSLFQEIINGVLPGAEIDRQTGAAFWAGTHAGTPFRVERSAVRVPNPVAGQTEHPVAQTLTMYRYTITLGKEKSEFLWHK